MAETGRYRPPFMGEIQKIGRALRPVAPVEVPLITDYASLETRVQAWSLDRRQPRK